jgi:hypothetical protein
VPVAQSILNTDEVLCHGQAINDTIMIELGWKWYGDDANMPDVSYIGEGGLCKSKWVHYDMRGPNPVIKGTNGPNEPIYTRDLHAIPQLHPNFDKAKGFQDNRLQIFVTHVVLQWTDGTDSLSMLV